MIKLKIKILILIILLILMVGCVDYQERYDSCLDRQPGQDKYCECSRGYNFEYCSQFFVDEGNSSVNEEVS